MTAWQDAEVARKFLEERRGAIPFGPEQVEVMLQVARHFQPNPTLIVDLGCGDGFLARTLLDAFPEASAVLLDHSPPMLERAREAMAPYRPRCRQILMGELAESIAGQVEGPADLIVSGYAIHHLPHARKRALYQEIFDLLAPGGLFVNVEHVASGSRGAEGLFDTLYIDHIAARTGKPRAQVEAEYHGRPDKADNKLERVEVQTGWLRELGFEDVDCYFKWLELAVFGGRKPSA
jgi:tRNA (cmo5U34)-methyltransferase